MFQKGDVVLYRLNISTVRDIVVQDAKKYYVLDSLEVDKCTYKVPIKNEFQSIVAFPSEKKLEQLLEKLKDIEIVALNRTMIEKHCKPIIQSIDLNQWLQLLKSLYYDKCDANNEGKKFPEKSKYYYEFVLHRFASIHSYLKDMQVDASTLYLEKLLHNACNFG